MRISALGVTHEANTFISNEVGEVVKVINVIMFDALSVVVNAIVVEATVAYQAMPLCPAWRHVRSRILVQVFTEVACNENTQS